MIECVTESKGGLEREDDVLEPLLLLRRQLQLLHVITYRERERERGSVCV